MITPMPFVNLPAQYAALKDQIQARMQRVLDHGQYIMGPEVAELEAALATYTGAKHCITVGSGTDALVVSLMALGIKAGDEVITVPFSFASSAEAVVLVGATPVFVDVEPDTALMDASLIEVAITPRTRAILPVSLYGQCADMAAINSIAARHGLPVIEDGAQSFGACNCGCDSTAAEPGKPSKPRRSGALSTFGATSFFPSKPLGCYGDGGAVFTNDDALARAAREIRVHGQSARYQHTRIGLGARMDTLQCAVLLAKLPRLPWELAQRQSHAQRYDAACAGLQAQGHDVQPITVRAGRRSVHGQYTVRLKQRDAVAAAMKAQGVPTTVHYPLALHHQAAYTGFAAATAFPHAVALAQQVLSLPMSADLGAADQSRVIHALGQALQQVAGQHV
jgi:UDP-2-acetamido-2-deoxy-ribo-hexuluronate aminotransferase